MANQAEQDLLQRIRALMADESVPTVIRSRWMLTLRYAESIGAGHELHDADEVPTLDLRLPEPAPAGGVYARFIKGLRDDPAIDRT